MKKLILISTFFLNGAFSADAQIRVSGYVRTLDSIPISHASVLLHDLSLPNNPLIKFTTSDGKGHYIMEIKDNQNSYLLTVKASAYKTVELKLKIPTGVSSFEKDFILHPSTAFLDTVKVNLRMSISKTGDTITFNPNAFALKNETTVEDLLSRMPGMEIKEGGKIFFNGKPVSSVLIDGDDLFKKDYQLLTQNAGTKIVDQIQVIKNYQKDQLLKEFNQPGSQVINLKIKDQFKNYLFGNGDLGYGNNGNKQADLFLIRLSPHLKMQAGSNYNTRGITYSSENKLNPANFITNENNLFSYRPAPELLDIDRYFFHNIPIYYQVKNESIQGYTNALFKKNKWESVFNARFARDKQRDNQQLNTIYRDGTNLFTHNKGSLINLTQEYKFSTTKNTKNESVYINTSLKNQRRNYGLQTVSNQSLESRQQLNGSDLAWQVNLNYNRKLRNGVLWSGTFGYFNQNNHGNLKTEPDFLFWLFPDNLTLNNLESKTGGTLSYIKAKSSLLFNSNQISNEIGLAYSYENRNFESLLQFQNLSEDSAGVPFQNKSNLHNSFLNLQYKGRIMISEKNKITISLSNEPHFFHYPLNGYSSNESIFFFNYFAGFSSGSRTSGMGVNIGFKREPVSYDLFFPDFVQTDFHKLQAGRIDTHGKKSTYLQANYNLFSIKMGWIAFILINLSRDKSNFIMNVETKGIGNLNSFYYYPNTTNQIFFVINSQKTTGDWPFSLNTNIIYNKQILYNRFNGEIYKSDLQFFNTTIGFKSLFQSIFNFDYNVSLFYSKNTMKSTTHFTTDAKTILNKLNFFITPEKLFNTTFTLNSMVSNQGTFHSNFMDLTLNRNFLKKKLLAEISYRNILNRKFISNTIITSLYKQENRVELRGAEIFVRLRYDIR